MIGFKYSKKVFCAMFVLLFLAVFTGCGNNTSLKGKVTFADGRPLTTGMVIFDNGAITSRAPINADGTYTVGTLKSNDGIPPGTYRVCISGAIELLDNPEEIYPPPSRELVHSKFTNPDTSELAVTVGKSAQKFDITVEPPL
jgi:hypothetical protein